MSAMGGYRSVSLEKHRDGELVPDHLALFDGDRLVAAAAGNLIRFYLYDDLVNARRLKSVAEWKTRAPVRHLSAGDRTVIAALEDGTLREAELSGRKLRDRQLEEIGGEVRAIVAVGDRMLVVLDTGDGTGAQVAELESQSGRVLRTARLPLANVVSGTALDPQRADSLLVVDSRHGAHVVRFHPDRDGAELELTAIDPQLRVTAAIAVSDQWIVAARKGGEIMHVRYTPALGGRADPTADACRRIRELLRRCGCHCEDDPGGESKPCRCGHGPTHPEPECPDGEPPDGERPDGPGHEIEDDEPCEERRRAHLEWTVGTLRAAGRHLVAVAARGDRLAVLDEQLNVVFERFLGPRGALLAVGSPSTDRMVSMRRRAPELEAWSLGDYARAVRGVALHLRRPRPSGSDLAEPVVFRGVPSRPGSANPHLRVAVFTVTEPGQPFGDPTRRRCRRSSSRTSTVCARLLRGELLRHADAGVHRLRRASRQPRTPLVLPRALRRTSTTSSAWRRRAVMPGTGRPPLRLETESMTVHTDPAFGTGRTTPSRSPRSGRRARTTPIRLR